MKYTIFLMLHFVLAGCATITDCDPASENPLTVIYCMDSGYHKRLEEKKVQLEELMMENTRLEELLVNRHLEFNEVTNNIATLSSNIDEANEKMHEIKARVIGERDTKIDIELKKHLALNVLIQIENELKVLDKNVDSSKNLSKQDKDEIKNIRRLPPQIKASLRKESTKTGLEKRVSQALNYIKELAISFEQIRKRFR